MEKNAKGDPLRPIRFVALAVTCTTCLILLGHWLCRYSDYTRTESGLQYQDLREGTGKSAAPGAQVTVDWDGYTIGEHLLASQYWPSETFHIHGSPALMLDLVLSRLLRQTV